MFRKLAYRKHRDAAWTISCPFLKAKSVWQKNVICSFLEIYVIDWIWNSLLYHACKWLRLNTTSFKNIWRASIFINILICMLTAVRLTPGGSSAAQIYTQIINRTTQLKTNREECGPCPVFGSYTLAFALQLSKKHGKTSVRVAEECQLARWKQNVQNRTYITIGIHKGKR